MNQKEIVIEKRIEKGKSRLLNKKQITEVNCLVLVHSKYFDKSFKNFMVLAILEDEK